MAFGIFERIWDFGYILKLLAIALNTFAMLVWLWGVSDMSLPITNESELALFYYAIPGFNTVLWGLLLLYILDEVPEDAVQKTYVLFGLVLDLIAGTVGVLNCTDNDFPHHMLVLSVVCVTIAAVLSLDYLRLMDFFWHSDDDDDEDDYSDD